MTEHSLLQDFIAETGEHLEQTERNLLRLEQRPEDARVLNEIFRAIHTIKGSSEYLGLERIAELSHKLENLLDLLRRGERALDGEGVDLLIGVNDRIGQLVDDLSRHQRERASIDDLVERIGSYTGHAEPISAEQAAGGPEPEGDGEVFGDEYDEELFGIFIGQLKEGLEALWDEARNLLTDPFAEAALARYEDRLGTLRSSANYMGYDKLKQIYDQWSGAVAEAGGRLSGGQAVDWDGFVQGMTADYIGRVKALFPKVETLTALEQHARGQQAPEVKEQGGPKCVEDDDIGIEMKKDAAASPPTTAEAVQPELALFSDSEGVSAGTPAKAEHSLLQDFIAETGEHLEQTERNLLRLEQRPEDARVLNEIFRAIHTIKGSSEYLGLERIAELSHKLENLLDLLRRGERALDGEGVDLLIGVNDRIGQLVDDLSRHQRERASIDDLVERIGSYTGHAEPISAEQAAGGPEPEGDGEVFGDEYDEELFGIFIGQLKEGLEALWDEARNLLTDPFAEAALARYEDRLGTLRSSANYMGYDKLKQIYDQWSGAVAEAGGRLSGGQAVDWDGFVQGMTADYIGRVKALFPKVETLTALEQHARGQQAPEAPETQAMPVQEQEEVETATASTGDGGLLEEFIVEAGEHLEEAERNLLLLSQHPGDIDTLNELFRAVHTIKGSSEYLGMTRIAELSHKLESLLDLLRRGQKVVDPAIADLLMVANDRIGMLVNDLANHGQEQSAIDDLVAGIDAFMQSAPSTPVAPVVPPEPAPAGTADAGAAATVYHEAYDSQLFAIFMAQFNEGLGALAMEAGQLASGEAARAIVGRCRPWLARLRSSANYMEYDELRGFYDTWIHAIDDSLERMPAHEEAAWRDDFRRMMQDSMGEARGFFATPETVAPVQTQDQEAQTPATDEQSLLARLERAFDAKIELSANTDAAAGFHLHMVSELLSGDDGLETLPVIGGDEPAARPPSGGALEGGDIESLLFSDAGSEKIPRKPMMPKPLARMTEGPGDLPEEDDRRVIYAPGRRRTDKFRDRLVKQSIRVEAAKIDMLMNQVGELVVNRAGFNQLFSEMREFQLLIKQTQKLSPKEMQIVKDLTNRINEATVSLGRVTSDLQENVMKVRMLPIAQLFSRYPRVVYDLVRNTDKKVDLDIHGEETELDRMVIEQISDPLVHIIRNAVDHGIEPVPERQRRGKPETGTLRLEAYHEGNYVVLEVSDDGRGIDIEQIKARALAKEFVQAEELETMTEDQILALIMRPGFSTVDEVTHTSGRGVGMDVVKDHIEKLNGTVEIVSTPGRSTLFRIRIPLTLAIIQALLVRVAGEKFTIPLSAVDETIRIHRNEISTIEGMEIYYLRETTLPLIRLAQVFKMQGARPDAQELFVVVVSMGSRQVGLIVDGLEGRQEVVIKPLEDYLQEQSGFSGATILGDGSISLILDVSDLVHLAIEQHARKMRAAAI